MAFLVGSSWGLTALCPQSSTHNGNGMSRLGSHPSAFWPKNWHSYRWTYENIKKSLMVSKNTLHSRRTWRGNKKTKQQRQIKESDSGESAVISFEISFAATPPSLLITSTAIHTFPWARYQKNNKHCTRLTYQLPNNWKRNKNKSNQLNRKPASPDWWHFSEAESELVHRQCSYREFYVVVHNGQNII